MLVGVAAIGQDLYKGMWTSGYQKPFCTFLSSSGRKLIEGGGAGST